MKIETTKLIHSSELRALCIKKEWYTQGTNEDYDKLFRKVFNMQNISDMDIYNIAKDIVEHSNKDKLLSECGLNEKRLIESFMYEINKISDVCFEIIDE